MVQYTSGAATGDNKMNAAEMLGCGLGLWCGISTILVALACMCGTMKSRARRSNDKDI